MFSSVVFSFNFAFFCLICSLCLLLPLIVIPLFFISVNMTLCNPWFHFFDLMHGESVMALTFTAKRFVSSSTGTRCMPYATYFFFCFQYKCHLSYLLMYYILIENATVIFFIENNISIFFRIGCYNLKCRFYVFILSYLIL